MLSAVARFIIGAIILSVAILIFAGMFMSRPAPERKPQEVVAPIVDVIELTPESITFQVASQGTVQPLTQTTLSAEVAGTVVTMSEDFVAGGTFVAGEVLMTIDPTNYRVAVDRAEASVRQRQIEYDGAKRLNEQGYRAEAELLSAEAALASARADLVRAERDLDRTVVRVPYNGIVRDRNAQLGDYVAPGAQLGSVFATDIVEVRLPLPDPDLAFVTLPLVSEGGEAQGPSVTLNGSFRGQASSWQGQIVRTEGVIDERNRMVFAVARVDDPYGLQGANDGAALPVGTFVTAAIDGVTMDNIAKIPRELVRGGNQVIFVDDESQLRFETLDFLRTDANYAYVYADQLLLRRVVATRLEAPLNGMKVRAGEDVEAPDESVAEQNAEPDEDAEDPSS
ncbi:MAG: efflux RND transporter periplasmic adaptor subunit [Pseudomonadota bacterium]